MAPVTSPSRVLVTGANGFIAAWIVRTFLESGYTVRGTVRSASKGEHLKSLFAAFGERFEIVVVEDIEKDGAFDEAVKGVDLVEHTASPVTIRANDPNELIVPAVRGTIGILESIKKHGSSVKRVVITGSTAAVITGPSAEAVVLDETSWNKTAILDIEQNGANAAQLNKYRASKTLAERAVWDFYEKNKSTLDWDVVVLNPPYVFGPLINHVSSLRALNASNQELYDTLVEGAKDAESLANTGTSWVDVRDVARAHVLAGEKDDAGGERIIVSAGPFYWQEIVDAANAVAPAPLPNLLKGNPGVTKGKPHPVTFDTSKMRRILGLELRGMDVLVRDTLASFAALEQKD
ncbi:D-lactaldehyde dehydrogenase [Artomyces pyxidatus]|uniref:D-lactaldehyde dehydrogenase n=1 Tax=Artomyces pyxidatus TaxID=48021 RepID=A0ACB8SJT8_9AGAM|nr:D-lactaldehyde dehydrogenase [Artomyces pyxidatus]